MNVIRFITILSILLLLISGCSDSGFILPVSPEDEIVLETVKSGSILSPGEEIPLSFEYEDIRPDLLKIILTGADNEQLLERTLEEPEFSIIETLNLPLLDSGFYKLTFILLEGEKLLLDETVSFFCSLPDEYAINEIIVYPPVLFPEGEGLFLADLNIPESTTPYLRWSMGGTVLSEGYLIDGSNRLSWDAPVNEGVYSVLLEVFPVGPEPGEEYLFNSEIYLKTEVFVSQDQHIEKSDFSPEESYYSLFHFRGEIIDFGNRPEKMEISIVGNPVFDIKDTTSGYSLDGSSGFKIDEMLLPFSANDYVLEPFSFKMRLLLDDIPKEKTLFRTVSDNGLFLFAVTSDEEGYLSVVLNTDEAEIISKSGMKVLDGLQEIIVSVVPMKEEIQFLMFINGEPVLAESYPYTASLIDFTGYSVICGENGISGLIDEFGVFTGNGIDPDVFYKTKELEYGNSLVYAEGFDGIYVPSNIVFSDEFSSGDTYIEKGKLVIQADHFIGLPPVTADFEELSLFLEFGAGSEGALNIESDTGELLLTVQLDGTVLFPESPELKLITEENLQELTLLKRDNELLLITPEEEIVISLIADTFENINLFIKNIGSEELLTIESILIIRTIPGLVETENSLIGNSASI